jgi:Xaa-Pro aminopeptidase
MIRTTLVGVAVLVLVASSAPAPSQEGAGPARQPVVATPKAFPFEFVLPRPSPEELRRRRAALAKEIGDGAAIVVSAEKPGVSKFRYAPDQNTYYLTGVDSDLCAMTLIAAGGKIASVKLFLPADDPNYELWNGKRVVAGDEAKALSGIDDVVKVRVSQFGESLGPLEEELKGLATSGKPVFVDSDKRRSRGTKLDLAGERRTGRIRAFLEAANADAEVRPLGPAMAPLRGVKSEWEIGVMREAVRITGEGFVRALREARPKMWEFDFQAAMDHTFAEFGCTGVPYFPIAASGPNACVYHYTDNRRQIQDGEIVLCDIAAEFGYYAADITRSFPVNGKFTDRQKLVYEAVLAGQTAAAKALKPGVNLMALDATARRAMREAGLKDKEMHQHGLGHHIGLDVHDLGDFKMQPGMVVTIEPGAYIKSESLGVRIEDMYLVTEDGAECLSARIPKTVAEIEALVGADWSARK